MPSYNRFWRPTTDDVLQIPGDFTGVAPTIVVVILENIDRPLAGKPLVKVRGPGAFAGAFLLSSFFSSFFVSPPAFLSGFPARRQIQLQIPIKNIPSKRMKV